MMPDLEAVNNSEAARSKMAEEATTLLSIKALNKLKNNGKYSVCHCLCPCPIRSLSETKGTSVTCLEYYKCQVQL